MNIEVAARGYVLKHSENPMPFLENPPTPGSVEDARAIICATVVLGMLAVSQGHVTAEELQELADEVNADG